MDHFGTNGGLSPNVKDKDFIARNENVSQLLLDDILFDVYIKTKIIPNKYFFFVFVIKRKIYNARIYR